MISEHISKHIKNMHSQDIQKIYKDMLLPTIKYYKQNENFTVLCTLLESII